MDFVRIDTFAGWRHQVRRLLADGISPGEVSFSTADDQPLLFSSESASAAARDVPVDPRWRVPKSFLDIANLVACHRDSARWELLYRIVWRLTHGEPHFLKCSLDPDISVLQNMHKSVTRDMHKMKAFVRFRKVSEATENGEHYVAWHRPDHRIVREVAPFFARRFRGMHWTILTPSESATWDQVTLRFGPGAPASAAPDGDELELLWKTYYASIFNPARVKVAMMKREMPVRHWRTLPETELIPELLAEAPARVAGMLGKTEGFAETAAHFMPADTSLPSLREAARACRACDLHCDATQTVFGEGPPQARIVIVGEQPGDTEDIVGKPFVGPAGRLLDRSLAQAGLDRSAIYVTNVVKHFKFTTRGKRRLHSKPDSRQIFACRPWLEAELASIQPRAVMCLGVTASQALMGRDFRLTQGRGKIVETEWNRNTIASWHPSAILRMPDSSRSQEMERQLIDDLCLAAAIHSEADE